MNNKISYKFIIKIAAVVAIMAWCVINFNGLISAIGKVLHILSPFIAGCIIAFVINVLMRFIEKKWDQIFADKNSKTLNKIKRPIAITLCLLVVFGILFAVVFIVIPGFYASIVNFIKHVPEYADTVNGWWAGLVAFAANHGVNLPASVIDANEVVKLITNYFNESGSNIINATLDGTGKAISGLINTVLSLIFAIYILATKERIVKTGKDTVHALLSKERARKFIEIAKVTEETFSNFVSGQCLEACCFGLMSFLGLLIFKFPYPGMIAIVLGFTTLIPVFGAFIGGAIGFVLIALTSPIKGIWFLVFLIVLQQLDNNLVYPKIVGKSVGLPGMLVLLAVTVGGSGFGVVGLLASVPLCAVLYGMYKGYIQQRLKQKHISEE